MNRVDLEIRLSKLVWIIANEVHAGVEGRRRRILRAVRVLAVYISGPGSAKIDVHYYTHILKVRVDIAGTLLIHCGKTKLRDLWSTIRDAAGDAASREVPVLDVF